MELESEKTRVASQRATIDAAVVSQDLNKVLEIAGPFIGEIVSRLPDELMRILLALRFEWGPAFLTNQLFTAFLRGWRSAPTDRKTDWAEDEVISELDFLVTNPMNTVMLTYANKINEYFCAAVWLFAKTSDPGARQAALSAATVADGEQRHSMVNYLNGLAGDWRLMVPDLPSVPERLEGLIEDIPSGEWKLEETVQSKDKLIELNPEYLLALEGSDPTIFRHRFPDVFRDYDAWYSPPTS